MSLCMQWNDKPEQAKHLNLVTEKFPVYTYNKFGKISTSKTAAMTASTIGDKSNPDKLSTSGDKSFLTRYTTPPSTSKTLICTMGGDTMSEVDCSRRQSVCCV